MSVALVPTALDELADLLIDMDDDEREHFIDQMDADELAVVEMAFRRRIIDRWRADPAAMADELDQSYERYRFSDMIAASMARLIDTAAGMDVAEPLRRLIIMLPPRYGKTLTGTIWSTVWGLDRHPHLRFVLASYGDDLARANSLAVRGFIEANAARLTVKLRRDARAVKHWYTTAGGHCRSVGVGSGLTGHGFDVGIMDDLFKDWQEAHSPVTREHVWNWYRSVFFTRQQKGLHSGMVYIGNRWHEDDLVGRLLDPPGDVEKEDWTVLRMPEIAEAPNPNGKPWEQTPDPLGRQPGEPLEPRRFPLEAALDRVKALGSYLAGCMLQQRPSSIEGGILKRAWWKFYGPRPLPEECDDLLISWDSSFADEAASSFCVGQAWARQGSRRLLLDQVRDRMDYPTFRSSVLNFSRRWPHITRVLIENKANGPAVIADLQGTVAGLMPREPKGSKESRAHAAAGVLEGGDVYLPDPSWNDIDHQVDRSFVHVFIQECALFPGGVNDDQVDTFTQAMAEWPNTEVELTTSYRRTGASRR